jgi:hypothetical protein
MPFQTSAVFDRGPAQRSETMNYVLYVIGTIAILTGLGAAGMTIQPGPELTSILANTVVLYVCGSLILSGVLICGFGSVIWLLKKIARNTREGWTDRSPAASGTLF